MSEYNWREHWEEKTPGGYTVKHVDLVREGWGKGPRYFIIYIEGRTPFFAKEDGKPCDNENRGGDCDDLVPKRKLRPWTAKEWGIRIGDEFVLDDNRVKLIAVARTTLCFEGASKRFPLPGPQYAARQDDKEITQLDGSPCGEYE